MFVSDTGRGSSLKWRDTEDLGSKAQLSSVVMNPRETNQHSCLFFLQLYVVSCKIVDVE